MCVKLCGLPLWRETIQYFFLDAWTLFSRKANLRSQLANTIHRMFKHSLRKLWHIVYQVEIIRLRCYRKYGSITFRFPVYLSIWMSFYKTILITPCLLYLAKLFNIPLLIFKNFWAMYLFTARYIHLSLWSEFHKNGSTNTLFTSVTKVGMFMMNPTILSFFISNKKYQSNSRIHKIYINFIKETVVITHSLWKECFVKIMLFLWIRPLLCYSLSDLCKLSVFVISIKTPTSVTRFSCKTMF